MVFSGAQGSSTAALESATSPEVIGSGNFFNVKSLIPPNRPTASSLPRRPFDLTPKLNHETHNHPGDSHARVVCGAGTRHATGTPRCRTISAQHFLHSPKPRRVANRGGRAEFGFVAQTPRRAGSAQGAAASVSAGRRVKLASRRVAGFRPGTARLCRVDHDPDARAEKIAARPSAFWRIGLRSNGGTGGQTKCAERSRHPRPGGDDALAGQEDGWAERFSICAH